ncbi:MAG: 2,3,4,5-tetrahydropyridine-2,6-dicarboxylate N-succinyltransferase [Steroidobacteraceae bacterium]
MEELRQLVERSFEARATLAPASAPRDLVVALDECLVLLGRGEARVAEPADGGWRVNEWLKKAVLLYFRTHDNAVLDAAMPRAFDKLPLKYQDYDQARFSSEGARIVPGAIVRAGAHVGRDAVLMPCFVNVGAHVGAGTMVDTWATVGSCAQIGRNVHLSGGVGIGGVLEPLQARPTIIEDDCFIGARSEVVEGAIVERGSVLSMGVFIGASTRIYDRETRTVSYGRVPAGSVVVPGSLPVADGTHSLYCAVIVKRVDAETRAKTSVNELLRT